MKKPNVKDYRLKPYSYILALDNYVEYLETEKIYNLFQKLVVRGCFKTDRDYEIAKQTLLEMTGIDYEQEIK